MWHCHILSHEEMDMMRPVIVNVPFALPLAPDPGDVLAERRDRNPSWTDGTPITYSDPVDFTNWKGKATGEVGYRILRADVAADGTIGAYDRIAAVPANSTTYHDQPWGRRRRTATSSRPSTSRANRPSAPTTASPNAPSAPTGLTAVLGASVHLDWVDNANETSFIVERADNGGAFAQITTLAADAVSFVDHPAPGSYIYRVAAANAGGRLQLLERGVHRRAGAGAERTRPTSWESFSPVSRSL